MRIVDPSANPSPFIGHNHLGVESRSCAARLDHAGSKYLIGLSIEAE
jgi:hypothetical protein